MLLCIFCSCRFGILPKRRHDAVTGATPKGSFDIKISPKNLSKFIIKAEFNHSRAIIRNRQGDENYSAESGQPALIYSS